MVSGSRAPRNASSRSCPLTSSSTRVVISTGISSVSRRNTWISNRSAASPAPSVLSQTCPSGRRSGRAMVSPLTRRPTRPLSGGRVRESGSRSHWKRPLIRWVPGPRRNTGRPSRSPTAAASPSTLTSCGQCRGSPGSATSTSRYTAHDCSKVPPRSSSVSSTALGQAQRRARGSLKRVGQPRSSRPCSTQGTQGLSGSGTASGPSGRASAATRLATAKANAKRNLTRMVYLPPGPGPGA